MKAYALAALLTYSIPTLAQTSSPATEQSAGSVEALDAKNGFRQYKLGSPMTDYPNLRSKGKLGYTAPGEPMNVGEFKISDLSFSAYKGRLSSITFMATGAKDAQGVLAALVSQYGEGEDSGKQMRAWKGKAVTMYCQTGGSALYPICLVILLSNEIIAQQNIEGNKAVKKAASDL